MVRSSLRILISELMENRLSFEGAEIASNEDAGVTVSYDETANTITLGNIPVSTAVNSIVIKAQYKLPLPNGEYKIIEPRIETFVKAKTFYVIHYGLGRLMRRQDKYCRPITPSTKLWRRQRRQLIRHLPVRLR